MQRLPVEPERRHPVLGRINIGQHVRQYRFVRVVVDVVVMVVVYVVTHSRSFVVGVVVATARRSRRVAVVACRPVPVTDRVRHTVVEACERVARREEAGVVVVVELSRHGRQRSRLLLSLVVRWRCWPVD